MFGTMNELIIAQRRIDELEAENKQLRELLQRLVVGFDKFDNAGRIGSQIGSLESLRLDMGFADDVVKGRRSADMKMTEVPDPQQRAFDNGVDAGKRLSSYGELPY